MAYVSDSIEALPQPITNSRVGLQIGSIYAGLVAAVYDLLCLASNEEYIQCQLNVQGDYVGEERYSVSDTKRKTMTHKQCKQSRICFLNEWKNNRKRK